MICPFKVGDRVHELRVPGVFTRDLMDISLELPLPELDPSKPDATVTALTARGFEYRYDKPIPFGRAADGCVAHGGTCYPEGYRFWRLVD